MSGHLATWGKFLEEHGLLGNSWKTPDGAFDSEILARILTAIRDGFSTAWAIGNASVPWPKLCDRRVDRALDLLSRKSLIQYDHGWVLGSAARSAPQLAGACGMSEHTNVAIATLLDDFRAWALATFPQSTPASCAAHLLREARELCDSPTDPGEIADCVFLAVDTAQRAGLDLYALLSDKLAQIKAREWGLPDAEGVVEHLRDGDEFRRDYNHQTGETIIEHRPAVKEGE